MDAPPIVSPEVLASVPPEILALIEWQARQIRILTARVAELEAKLEALSGKNPTNSSKPPSSTHPHAKPPRPNSRATRRQGGQPSNPRHERPLLPSGQCDDVIPLKPATCQR